MFDGVDVQVRDRAATIIAFTFSSVTSCIIEVMVGTVVVGWFVHGAVVDGNKRMNVVESSSRRVDACAFGKEKKLLPCWGDPIC